MLRSASRGLRQLVTRHSFRSPPSIHVELHEPFSTILFHPQPLYGSLRSFHRIPGLSARDMAEIEDCVSLAVGSNVSDPEIGASLKDLGWVDRRLAVSSDGTVHFTLRVPTLLHPSLEELKDRVARTAEGVIRDWRLEKSLPEIYLKVNVEAIAAKPVPVEAREEVASRLGPGLANVANYVAVYSCKGGVGKSTIAVNLAYELARLGGRVGLLDLDVYGPSLPSLVTPTDPAVRHSPLGKGMVYPIEHEGVKLLSLGFVSSKSGVPGSDGEAAILRGPMAGKVVTQLLKGTDWGDLDVLILDLPPGTGDIQLTLCQDVELSGVVGVTTPCKLAVADARKGIQMFTTLGIPILALVDNMSFFECPEGTRHYPFGNGFQDFVESMTEINADNVCQLPLSLATNSASEQGVPFALSRPANAIVELEAISKLARIVSRELLKLPFWYEGTGDVVSFDDAPERFALANIELSLEGGNFWLRAFTERGAVKRRISPNDLRPRDPKSGEILENERKHDQSPPDAKRSGMILVHGGRVLEGTQHSPERLEKKGKVGFEVLWGDGARVIYSRRAIVMAAGGRVCSSSYRDV